MGKSIRSKIKRKHRAEFRATIGTRAAKEQMAVVQEKLKECVEKGSMNSLERISSLLETEPAEAETGAENMDVVPVDTMDSMQHVKGENKVPTKKRRNQKHTLRKPQTTKAEESKRLRPKPKYFCRF